MRYYGKFESARLPFDAYIEGESLKEALDIALKSESNIISFWGCELYKYKTSLYCYRDKHVKLKDLYFWRFTRKKKKQIRKLIQDGIIKGKAGLFKIEFHLLDFTNYCAEQAQRIFEGLNIEAMLKLPETKEEQIESYEEIRDVIINIMEDGDIDDYVSEEDKIALKNNRQEMIKLMNLREKEEYLAKTAKIPALATLLPKTVYQQRKSLTQREIRHILDDPLLYRVLNWIILFEADFQSTPVTRLFYVILTSVMKLGYQGIKFDAYNEQMQVLTVDGEFALEERITTPGCGLLYELPHICCIFMEVPYTAIDGRFVRKRKFNDKEIMFTLNLGIEEYGQSVILKWRSNATNHL